MSVMARQCLLMSVYCNVMALTKGSQYHNEAILMATINPIHIMTMTFDYNIWRILNKYEKQSKVIDTSKQIMEQELKNE